MRENENVYVHIQIWRLTILRISSYDRTTPTSRQRGFSITILSISI